MLPEARSRQVTISTPVGMDLRPPDSDENRCKDLEGGLQPARGFIPAGGHSGPPLFSAAYGSPVS